MSNQQTYEKSIKAHYGQTNFSTKILTFLQQAGKDINALTRADIATFDEFHIRGRKATQEMGQLAGLQEGMRVLDIGCGIGGPARTLAAEFGCQVTGLDLVEEYCEAAYELTERVGLSDKVTFRHGNALDLPFEVAAFEVVWTQHMSMNIEDKEQLFGEIRRVLRPGGRLAMYEVFAGEVTPAHFPVPWANDAALSFLVPAATGRKQLQEAGFKDGVWDDVSTLCLNWFKQLQSRLAAQAVDTPPPLGIELLMGTSYGTKIANVIRNLTEQRIVVIQAVLE